MTAVLHDIQPALRVVFFEDSHEMLAWLGKYLPEVDLISLDHDDLLPEN